MKNSKDIDQVRIKALLEQQEAFKKELIEQQKEINQLRKDQLNHYAMHHEDDGRADGRWD